MLEQQKILIQRQIQEEKSKKDPDKKRIKEWEKQYEEITNLIEDNAAKAQDAIFGSDIQAAINDFAEAYADAWAQGEDRAKSAKDFVKNMIKQMIIEAMKADIQPSMQIIRDKLEKFWEDDIITQEEENVIDKMIEKSIEIWRLLLAGLINILTTIQPPANKQHPGAFKRCRKTLETS